MPTKVFFSATYFLFDATNKKNSPMFLKNVKEFLKRIGEFLKKTVKREKRLELSTVR